jgi:hypothetical protein
MEGRAAEQTKSEKGYTHTVQSRPSYIRLEKLCPPFVQGAGTRLEALQRSFLSKRFSISEEVQRPSSQRPQQAVNPRLRARRMRLQSWAFKLAIDPFSSLPLLFIFYLY